MTFMQLLFSVQGDMFVCVCLHVYDNHTNVLCILKRDGVCSVESPPPVPCLFSTTLKSRFSATFVITLFSYLLCFKHI